MRHLALALLSITLGVVLVACGEDTGTSMPDGSDAGSDTTPSTSELDDPCSDVALWDWTRIPVDATPTRVRLTLADDGRPHVAFWAVADDENVLFLATASPTADDWSIERITSHPFEETSRDIELARPVITEDAVHLLFVDGEADIVRHARRDAGGAWTVLDLGATSIGPSALTALDDGRLMAAFADADGLSAAWFDGASWSEPVLVEAARSESGTVGTGASAAPLEIDGEQHIVFHNARHELRIATRSADTWTVDPVATLGDPVGQGPLSMAFDGRAIHLLYPSPSEMARQPLAHYSDEGGAWQSTEVYPQPTREVSFSDIEWFTSMVARPGGDLHATIGNMKGCDGTELLSREQGTWSRTVIFPEPLVQHTSIARSLADDQLHVALISTVSGTLYYGQHPLAQ